jgi:hypothetical protein
LTDGTEVNGPISLRAAVLAEPERFVAVVTEKLMTYALGRGLEYFDMPRVRSVVRDAAADDYRFSALVLGIATSESFRMKEIQPPETDAPAATAALAAE